MIPAAFVLTHIAQIAGTGTRGARTQSDVAAKAAKHDKAPVGRAGRFCPASEQDRFRYEHPGCSYLNQPHCLRAFLW
jgi:hypothetical protein